MKTDNREIEILDDLKRNQVVYKYIKLEYLIQILRNRKIKLKNTSSWEEDDCNENFILNHEFECGNSIKTFYDYKSDVFGQSWTLKKESDEMWRIYSEKIKSKYSRVRDFYGVAAKIQTKVGSLIDLFSPQKSAAPFFSSFAIIGKVHYYKDDEIRQWIQDNINKIPGESYSQMFFIKRKPFEFEKEVRFIYDANKSSAKSKEEIARTKKVRNFHIDPETVFEKYVLDPRLSDEQYEIIKKEIIGLGVPSQRIEKSQLHRFDFSQGL